MLARSPGPSLTWGVKASPDLRVSSCYLWTISCQWVSEQWILRTMYEAREMVNVHPPNGTFTCLLSGHFLRALSCLLHPSPKVQNYISTITNILLWPPHCSAPLGCPGPVSAEPAQPRPPFAGPVLMPPALCSLYTSLPQFLLQTTDLSPKLLHYEWEAPCLSPVLLGYLLPNTERTIWPHEEGAGSRDIVLRQC